MLLRRATDAGGCDCSTDPVACLEHLFVDVTQKTRMLAGQCPVRRAVFLKQHGSAYGELVVRPGLPDDLRVGVLAGQRYPVWVRFSSDIPPKVGSVTAVDYWSVLAPVGSLQEARKVVYQASATLRRNANGIPLVEPRSPRP